MKFTQYPASELGFNRTHVSENAVSVIEGLQNSGFDGYLVGGCVRDLILGRQPKDFDVTTNASPEQIKKIFNRAMIIGRRFKLVHVSFGRGRDREIIEVATYRAAPPSGKHKELSGKSRTSKSGRILDDNVYGTIEADALRRDFTINALYYDPIKEKVIDFVNGIDDTKTKTLRLIGDTRLRFTEDPVRMLRVIRFQAKLDLNVEESISRAIAKNAALLEDVPAARLFEEVLKLFHYAAAVKTWQQIRTTLLLYYLFPQTVKCINGDGGNKFETLILSALGNTDRRVQQNKPVIPAFLFAVMLWWPFKNEFDKLVSGGVRRNEAFWIASDLVFKQQSSSVTLPLRVKGPAHEIWEMQSLLENRIPRSIHRLLENRRFRAAYDFLLLRQQIGEVSSEIVDWWTRIQDSNDQERDSLVAALPKKSGGSGKNPKLSSDKPAGPRRSRQKYKGRKNSPAQKGKS
jgi:poly(A) polymerase